MYVCLCSGVTDKQIIEAVKNGHGTLADLNEQLGLGANCGSCLSIAKDIIDQCRYDAELDAAIFYKVA